MHIFRQIVGTVGLAVAALAAIGELALAADWPQIAHDPQRSGYQPENTPIPAKIAWEVNLDAERVHPQQQVIVAGGRAFIGTLAGKLHAYDAKTGKELWTFKTVGADKDNGAIIHSVGVEGGTVYCASLDGNVYAVEIVSGNQRWRFESHARTGFSCAILLAEGKVLVGGRNGTFYALDAATGSKLWEQPLGAPILGTAAYHDGRVYIGAEDMHLRALDAKTGKIVWTSEQLNGLSMKDFWPVVHKGKVLIRPWFGPYDKGAACSPWVWPFQWAGDKSKEFTTAHAKELGAGKLPAEVEAGQDAAIAKLQEEPSKIDLFVLDEQTGKQTMIVPHWAAGCMNGAVSPPCVDRDGLLVMGIVFHISYYGRLDLDKGRLTDIPWNASGERWGGGNGDENVLISAAGDYFLSVHFSGEPWSHQTGVFDLSKRQWHSWPARFGDGGGGGMGAFTMHHNCQGGGGTPVSFADRMAFHQCYHRVYGRIGQ